MIAEQFRKYWSTNYPEAFPIGHELKSIYKDRWFRIHRLPDSKRYADNDEEYKIILNRQNTLISDVFGNHNDFIILVGLYTDDLANENYDDLDYIDKFHKVDTLALHELRPEENEFDMYYDIFIQEANWKTSSHDDLLIKIAHDEIRAIFINLKAECIVYPYDGGVDVIFKDSQLSKKLKTKYSEWLSSRIDGM